MSQDYTQGERYKTAQKKITNREQKTPATRIRRSLALKIRQSSHKKILYNRCLVYFTNFVRKKKKQQGNNQTLNKQYMKLMEQQCQSYKRKQDLIEEIFKIIIKYKVHIHGFKADKTQIRNLYLSDKNFLQQKQKQNTQTCIPQFRVNINNIQIDSKKYLYQLGSRQDNLNYYLNKHQRQIQKQRFIFEKNTVQFKSVTQKFAEVQVKFSDLSKRMQKKVRQLNDVKANYNLEVSQVFVLKFQINPNLFCGFISNKTGITPKMLLDKQYFRWDKTKQKKITFQDLKRFVLIQLCCGWKNLVRKISYQSSQYQVLFGQIQNETVLEDLRRFLSFEKIRTSSKKTQKHIIFYSQVKTQINRKQIIRNLFINFDNGIIRIHQVQFLQSSDRTELQIIYTYLNECQSRQVFIYEQYDFINKQKVMKDIKSIDKRIFCLIEIPFVANRQNIQRYNQIYDLIYKKKTNSMGTMNISSK